MTLRTEADVVRSLAGRAITLDELYATVEATAAIDRDNGHAPIPGHGTDTVWRRRVRNTLQSLKRQGHASRVSDGTWLIDGTREQPRRMLLILAGEPGVLELRLADAERFLQETDEPLDLVIGDPPYQLYGDGEFDPKDQGGTLYARSRDNIAGGYVEVDGDYGEFTHRWMNAAKEALRPGAYLIVVTGTTMAWRVGHAAHDLDLTEICQLAVQRRFALRSTRQPAYAHWVVNVYSHGPKYSDQRFFHCIPELPKARSGRDYPLDIWAGDLAPPKADRRGLYRYRNALPVELVDRLVRMFTEGPDNGGDPWQSLVADPFLGSGTTAVACLQQQRRFQGADLNPESLRFTAARIAEEELSSTTQLRFVG